MGRRTWIKIYSEKWLRGSIRKEKPEVRGIWMDILMLAAQKYTSSSKSVLSNSEISNFLNLEPRKWELLKIHFKKLGYFTEKDEGLIVNPLDLASFHVELDSEIHRIVFELDNCECVYCGNKEQLSIDHVIPASKGGSGNIKNLVTACMKCNQKKHARTPKEAGMELKYGRFKNEMD